jgi:hypothetical protein
VLFEVEDVGDFGSAPRVDRLVVVADHDHVVVRGGQKTHQLELRFVGVLVLVDQNVAKALLPFREHLFAAPKKAHRFAHQIVEVEGRKPAQRGAVLRIDDFGDFVVLVPFPLGQVRFLEELIFGGRDAGDDGAHVVASIGAKRAQDLAHGPRDIALIEDRELAVTQAEDAGLRRQDAHAEAVKRGNDELAGELFADQARDPLFHFGGGLVGERHRQDGARQNAALEQARDSHRDHARLAGSGAGQDQHGAVIVLDGFALRGVQEVVLRFGRRYGGGHDARAREPPRAQRTRVRRRRENEKLDFCAR